MPMYHKRSLQHCIFIISLLVPLKLAHQASYTNLPQSEYASDQNTASFLKKEYSLTKPYQGPWDFAGSTVIATDFIRLTPDAQSNRGAVWSTQQVNLRHWEVHVTFRIHGTAGNLFGDGMAFWYVDRESTRHTINNRQSTVFDGPIFGVQDKFKGLAVLLDTYSNHNGPHSHDHPYISAMVNNGSLSYDHDRDGTHSQLTAGCTSKFRNRDYDTRLSIRYVDETLTVSTDVENQGRWQVCFHVSNVRLPTHYVFGVSAMTGDLSDNHDLKSVKVYELQSKNPNSDDPNIDYRKILPLAESAESERPHIDEPAQSSWSLFRIFLAVLFTTLGLAGLAILGCVYYTRQERTKKRFY